MTAANYAGLTPALAGLFASRPRPEQWQALRGLGERLSPDLEALLKLEGVGRKTMAHELAQRMDLKESGAQQWIGHLVGGNWGEWLYGLIHPKPNSNIHVQRLEIALAYLGVRQTSSIISRIKEIFPDFSYDYDRATHMKVTSPMREVRRAGGTYRRQADGPQYPMPV